MTPPAASTAAARTEAPPAPQPRRLQAAGVPARKPGGRQAPGRAAPGRRVSSPPRRVSGPSRRPAQQRARRQDQTSTIRTLAGGAAAAALRLPDHRLLDRLVRGRYWIAVVGAALIGMVAMQVAMLRINSDIGGYVDKAASLERANAVIAAENSRLATVSRIEAEGARLGLVLPHPDAVRYRFAQPGDAAAAVTTMRSPTPAAPVSQATTPSAQTQTTAPAGSSVTTPVTGTAQAGTTTATAGAAPPAGGTPAAAGTTAQTQGTSQGTP